MEILVCKASEEIINECPDGLFKSPDGNHFMYKINYTENDYLTITDSVGRSMPMDYTEIEDIAEMLARIVRYQLAKACVEEALMDGLMNVPTENDKLNAKLKT